jgi:hypothetical protein
MAGTSPAMTCKECAMTSDSKSSRGIVISPELQIQELEMARRVWKVGELPPHTLDAIKKSSMSKRHCDLDQLMDE